MELESISDKNMFACLKRTFFKFFCHVIWYGTYSKFIDLLLRMVKEISKNSLFGRVLSLSELFLITTLLKIIQYHQKVF